MTATLGVAFIVVGVLFSAINWLTLFVRWRSGRFVSGFPFVGGVSLACGMALLPETRAYLWVALAADYGTLVGLCGLPSLVWEIWSTSPINLVHCFVAVSSGRTVVVRFFRRGIATVRLTFDPPASAGDVARVLSVGMIGTWSASESGFVVHGYRTGRQLILSRTDEAYLAREENPPVDSFAYESLDGLALRKH